MFGDVISFGTVRIVPVASEYFTENRVKRLLDSTALASVVAYGRIIVADMRTGV